jgi:hypothetical protein
MPDALKSADTNSPSGEIMPLVPQTQTGLGIIWQAANTATGTGPLMVC